MKVILTVTGLDHEGIIAAVTTRLAELHVNVLNVSQSLMEDYFTMILLGSFDDSLQGIEELQESMRTVEAEQKVAVRIQSQAIFDAMHSI